MTKRKPALYIRMSVSEKAQVQRAAKAAGMSVSEFVRQFALLAARCQRGDPK